MGKESIILGVLLALGGVALIFLGAPFFVGIVLIVVGVFLIIFWKAEDTIELRKDVNEVKKRARRLKK